MTAPCAMKTGNLTNGSLVALVLPMLAVLLIALLIIPVETRFCSRDYYVTVTGTWANTSDNERHSLNDKELDEEIRSTVGGLAS